VVPAGWDPEPYYFHTATAPESYVNVASQAHTFIKSFLKITVYTGSG